MQRKDASVVRQPPAPCCFSCCWEAQQASSKCTAWCSEGRSHVATINCIRYVRESGASNKHCRCERNRQPHPPLSPWPWYPKISPPLVSGWYLAWRAIDCNVDHDLSPAKHRTCYLHRPRSGSFKAKNHGEIAKLKPLQQPSVRLKSRSSACAPRMRFCTSDRRCDECCAGRASPRVHLTPPDRAHNNPGPDSNRYFFTCHAGTAFSIRGARGRRGEHAGRQHRSRRAGDRASAFPKRLRWHGNNLAAVCKNWCSHRACGSPGVVTRASLATLTGRHHTWLADAEGMWCRWSSCGWTARHRTLQR